MLMVSLSATKSASDPARTATVKVERMSPSMTESSTPRIGTSTVSFQFAEVKTTVVESEMTSVESLWMVNVTVPAG